MCPDKNGKDWRDPGFDTDHLMTKDQNYYQCVTGCVAAGEMAIYGANASNVGGIAGSTNGTSITSSFSMVVIYTDASYVGGLVGRINSGPEVETVYSTGNIINSKYDHVGGLFGSSAVNVSDSYTTVRGTAIRQIILTA